MDHKTKNQSSEKRPPSLRIVQPEELAGLVHKPLETQRNRSHLINQLTDYCDQLDREIERILRL